MEKKYYGKVAKRGVTWSLLGEVVSTCITLPRQMIMARLLTPFDFGVAASASFFIALAGRLTNVGFNAALIRTKNLQDEHCSSVFVVSVLLGASAYLALTASAGSIGAFFDSSQVAEVVPVAALSFLINPFGTVSAALLVREMRYRENSIAGWIGDIAQAVAAVVFALLGWGFWSIVWSLVVGDVALTVARLVYAKWSPRFRASRSALSELASFGMGMSVKRLLDYAANNVDNLVVGRLLGVGPLGVYDKAFNIAAKVVQRSNTGGPSVSFRIFALIRDEPERFRRALSKLILTVSLFGYPVLFGFAAAGVEVIVVLFGRQWEQAIVPFRILCLAGALKMVNSYSGSAVQAWGKIWAQVRIDTFYALLIVVLAGVGSQWGLPGVAMGVLAATCILTVLMQMLVIRLTGVSAADLVAPQLPGLLAGAGVAMVALSLQALFAYMSWSSSAIVSLLLQAAACSLFYLGFLKFNRFRQVRALLVEMSEDLAKPIGRIVALLV